MTIKVLIEWVNECSGPACLLENNTVIESNAAFRDIFGASAEPSITFFAIRQYWPELAQAMRESTPKIELEFDGRPYLFRTKPFNSPNDASSTASRVIVTLDALTWPGSPPNMSSRWWFDVSVATPGTVFPLVVQPATGALSAPASTLRSLGLASSSRLDDWLESLNEPTRTMVAETLQDFSSSPWRRADNFQIRLTLSGKSNVDAECCVRRLDGALGQQGWLGIAVRSQGATRAVVDLSEEIATKTGSGCFLALEIIGFMGEGDEAKSLQHAIRAQIENALIDVLVAEDRLWSDETSLINIWLHGDTRGKRAENVWGLLVQLFDRPFGIRDTAQRFRIRGGSARAVNPGTKIRQLYDRARDALVEATSGELVLAKPGTQKGKPTQQDILRRHNQIQNDFEEGRYRMIYQPLSPPAEIERPVGVEALSRCISSSGEMISGGEIMSSAVRHNYVREWTLWGLDCLARELKGWLEEEDDRFVTFNVMPSLFALGTRHDWFFNALGQLPSVVLERLKLEITEQSLGELFNRNTVDRIRDHGVELYLDDFGAGHSNLYRLLEVRPDAIKFDRFLINNLAEDRRQFEVFQKLVDLAKEVSPVIISEGIETEAQLEMIRQLDVDWVQGYFVGRKLDMKTVS